MTGEENWQQFRDFFGPQAFFVSLPFLEGRAKDTPVGVAKINEQHKKLS